jgi:hypothetical protein
VDARAFIEQRNPHLEQRPTVAGEDLVRHALADRGDLRVDLLGRLAAQIEHLDLVGRHILEHLLLEL